MTSLTMRADRDSGLGKLLQATMSAPPGSEEWKSATEHVHMRSHASMSRACQVSKSNWTRLPRAVRSAGRAPAALVSVCRFCGALCPPVTILREGAPDVLDFFELTLGITPSREDQRTLGGVRSQFDRIKDRCVVVLGLIYARRDWTHPCPVGDDGTGERLTY